MSNILKRKRNRSQCEANRKKKSTIKDISYVKNCRGAPNSRTFHLVLNEDEEVSVYINSKNELEQELIKNGFERPYYIDEKGKKILINNLGIFFHSTNINTIYKMEEYRNIIDEKTFEEQYFSIPNKLFKETLYINKLFFNNNNYYKYHTNNFQYICFINYDIYAGDLRDFCCTSETKRKIVEIFRKRKVGITTFLTVLYSQLRTRLRTEERFIPFILFDYNKLINTNKIKSLIDLINTSIVNLFVHYDDYNDFCSLVYDEIKGLIFDIDKIIIKIIELFIERLKNPEMSYVPA